MNLYEELRDALRKEVQRHHLSGQNISVRCKALSAAQAIGIPEHDDYPIIKGREVMVEAVFDGARGQAFTDEFENADITIDELLNIKLNSNRRRSVFISSLNAIFRYLNLCDKSIHCRDTEPVDCAHHLCEAIGSRKNVLLVGYQPRFLEVLASHYSTRVVDMNKDNIESNAFDIVIEPPEKTPDAVEWCDLIFATGSTVVNGTISDLLYQDKPVLFYGVTISAAASILNLKTYCYCGH